MDLLQNILGGGQQRQQFQDFANRYQQGAPFDGISDEEALQNYQRVAPHLPQQLWQESAEESFSRLSPQQRMELGRYLQRGHGNRTSTSPTSIAMGWMTARRTRAILPRSLARCASSSPVSSASCSVALWAVDRWEVLASC